MGDRDFQWAVDAVVRVADDLRARRADTVQWSEKYEEALRAVASRLAADPESGVDPFVDIIAQIPTNPSPSEPPAWWVRELTQIRGVTIHHTMSHDPIATARHLIGKGRPGTEYHFWVSITGDCWLCAPLQWGFWHDHTGHRNSNVSIGMAGHLHKVRPPLAQLNATVRLVRWLMAQFSIPLKEIQGHNDRYTSTVCPGWDVSRWRSQFYDLLREAIEE